MDALTSLRASAAGALRVLREVEELAVGQEWVEMH